ncbi:hypothetical protein [Microbacterium oleivorans]|uniref:hypothetical protein n=1 Tax=Microbacterium oleivorans TaxID=273677 RepID=UPI0009F35A30|nr:hypothetical protein [Microbacterium oleivorans]
MTTAPAAPLDDLDPANTDGPAASAPRTGGPRTRWAAIVWGLTFAAIAAGGYAVTSSTRATAALIDAVADAEIGSAVAIGLLMVGGLVAVAGLAGLLRAAQRFFSQRRLHQSGRESTHQP